MSAVENAGLTTRGPLDVPRPPDNSSPRSKHQSSQDTTSQGQPPPVLWPSLPFQKAFGLTSLSLFRLLRPLEKVLWASSANGTPSVSLTAHDHTNTALCPLDTNHLGEETRCTLRWTVSGRNSPELGDGGGDDNTRQRQWLKAHPARASDLHLQAGVLVGVFPSLSSGLYPRSLALLLQVHDPLSIIF